MGGPDTATGTLSSGTTMQSLSLILLNMPDTLLLDQTLVSHFSLVFWRVELCLAVFDTPFSWASDMVLVDWA